MGYLIGPSPIVSNLTASYILTGTFLTPPNIDWYNLDWKYIKDLSILKQISFT